MALASVPAIRIALAAALVVAAACSETTEGSPDSASGPTLMTDGSSAAPDAKAADAADADAPAAAAALAADAPPAPEGPAPGGCIQAIFGEHYLRADGRVFRASGPGITMAGGAPLDNVVAGSSTS